MSQPPLRPAPHSVQGAPFEQADLVRFLPASGHRRMPWKNGKGVTIEIAIHPADASIDTFNWRLSTATVDSDGPFSAFEGIERSLAVLDGDGLVLEVEGQPTARLTVDSDPLGFPADRATMAHLIGAPVTDLNAMSRRGHAHHKLSRHEVAGDSELSLQAPDQASAQDSVQATDYILFCANGVINVAGHQLAKLDCLHIRAMQGLTLTTKGNGMLYLARFHSHKI